MKKRIFKWILRLVLAKLVFIIARKLAERNGNPVVFEKVGIWKL